MGWTATVRILVEAKLVLKSTMSRPVLGFTQSLIKLLTICLSQGLKQPGHEADHSPASTADIKKNIMFNYLNTGTILRFTFK
jgi:hypothetical protein